jgi:hypothetical protein
MTLIPDLERDLVEAAGRVRAPRGRARHAAPYAVAAAAVAALAVGSAALLGGDDARDGPSRAAEQPDQSPPPPQRRVPRALHGSASAPLTFGFDGVRYRVVGFRSRQDSICLRLNRLGSHATMLGVTCSGERNLRRGLRREAVLKVGAGGGKLLTVSGFVTPDVTELVTRGTKRRSRVFLTEPWRPKPWAGDPIRGFIAVLEGEAGGGRSLIRELGRIQVVPTPR